MIRKKHIVGLSEDERAELESSQYVGPFVRDEWLCVAGSTRDEQHRRSHGIR